MELNDSLGKATSLLTIDTSVAAPHGGTVNVLNIVGTGGLVIPVGTTAQQPSNTTGMIRFNSDTTSIDYNNGSGWGVMYNSFAYENDITITANHTITSGKNAVSAGPITISNGITVTVPTGSTWTIV